METKRDEAAEQQVEQGEVERWHIRIRQRKRWLNI